MLSPVTPVPENLPDLSVPESLTWAHPLVQEWFVRRFSTPTEPQEQGWPVILAEKPVLISAPTGSGKTLAAFLICIDGLIRKAIEGRLGCETEVVYVSPLKALSNDVQKNLETPLREIQQLALERGYLCPPVRAAVRTGDTPAAERRAMLKTPPHILVTTPESLYILLTAQQSREHLRRVHTVIVDEIHAIADDKRGSHLALSLERLDALVTRGKCADGRARVCSGIRHRYALGYRRRRIPLNWWRNSWAARVATKLEIVQAGQRRTTRLGDRGADRRVGLRRDHGYLGERLHAARRADPAAPVDAGVRQHAFDGGAAGVRRWVNVWARRMLPRHHGSLSRKLRLDAERRLKNGEIRVLIATASLELGIDIGTVDLVCQIPVAAGDFCRDAARGSRGALARRNSQRAILCSDARRPHGAGRAHPRDAGRRARSAGDSDQALRCADAADRGDLRRGAVGGADALWGLPPRAAVSRLAVGRVR